MTISELCSASIVRLKEGAIGAVSSDVVAESRDAAPAAANDGASLTHSTRLHAPLSPIRNASKSRHGSEYAERYQPELRRMLRKNQAVEDVSSTRIDLTKAKVPTRSYSSEKILSIESQMACYREPPRYQGVRVGLVPKVAKRGQRTPTWPMLLTIGKGARCARGEARLWIQIQRCFLPPMAFGMVEKRVGDNKTREVDVCPGIIPDGFRCRWPERHFHKLEES